MRPGPLTYGALGVSIFSSFSYMREAAIGPKIVNLASVTESMEGEVHNFDQQLQGSTKGMQGGSPVLDTLLGEEKEEPKRLDVFTTSFLAIFAIAVVFAFLWLLGHFEQSLPHPSQRKLETAGASMVAAVIFLVELIFYVVQIPPGQEPVLQATSFEGNCHDITCPAYQYDVHGLFASFALFAMHAATSYLVFRSIFFEQGNREYNWWVLFWQVTTGFTVFALVNAWDLFDRSYAFIVVGSAHLVFGDIQLSLRLLSRLGGGSPGALAGVPGNAGRAQGFSSRAPHPGIGVQAPMAIEAAAKDKTLFRGLVVGYLFTAILLISNYSSWQLFLIVQKSNFVVHGFVMLIYFYAMVLMLRGASAPSEFWWQFFAHIVHMAGEWIPTLVEQVQKVLLTVPGSEDGTNALDTRILLGIIVVIQACVCLMFYNSDNFVKVDFLECLGKGARSVMNQLAQVLRKYQWILLSRVFWFFCLGGQAYTVYLQSGQEAAQDIEKPFNQRNVPFGKYHSVSDGTTVAVFVYLQVTFPIMIYLIQQLLDRRQDFFFGIWNEMHFMLWSLTSAVTVAFFVYRPALDSPIWWVDSIIHLLLDLKIAYTRVASLNPILRNVAFLTLMVVLSIPVAGSTLSGANAGFTRTHVTRIFLDLNAVWHLIVNLALIINPRPTLSAQPTSGRVRATGDQWAVMENWAIFFHLSPVILAKVPMVGWNASSTDDCLFYACYGRLLVLLASALTLFCTFQLQSNRG